MSADASICAELLAGGIGGGTGVFFGYPLDFVKVRLQTMHHQAYTGPLDCLRRTVVEEGVRGLYRGATPPVLNGFAMTALLFGGQAHGRALLKGRVRNQDAITFLSGAYAGALSASTTVPVELVKCQMQVDRARSAAGIYRDGWHCMRLIVEREGLAGAYRGLAATLLCEAPKYGVFFLAFQRVETELKARLPLLRGDAGTLIAGAASGVLAWLVAYPLDTVKSRVQALPLGARGPERSLLGVVGTLHAQHGLSYFWRGIGTCLLRAAPVNAITFAVCARVKAMMAPPLLGDGSSNQPMGSRPTRLQQQSDERTRSQHSPPGVVISTQWHGS